MKDSEKAKLKDRILNLIIRDGETWFKQGFFLNRLSPDGLDEDLIITLLKEIEQDGYIKINESATESNLKDLYLLRNSEGTTFMNHYGGYYKRYQKDKSRARNKNIQDIVIKWGGWLVALISLIYTIFYDC